MKRSILSSLWLLAAALAPAAPPPAVPRPSAAEVRSIDEALVACGTRQSLTSWTDPKRGVGCGRDRIVAYFREVAAKDPRAHVVVDHFNAQSPRTHGSVPLQNVYLVVTGDDPALARTALLVSGHYDTMCSDVMDSTCDAPGADDDGSGTTVSVEAARLLAGLPHRATLVFATVSGEEQGLLGGQRLLAWTKEQGFTVGGMLNNDIVGATNGSSDFRPRVFCDDEPFTASRELGLWLDEFLGRDGVRIIFRKDRFGRGGDHLPFVEAGLPAVRFTEPREDYRHQHQTPRVENGVEYGDLPKFMNFDFLARVAQLNAQALLDLANAPAPPADVLVEGAVRPNATISFSAPADGSRTGFEILARDTTEPRWRVLRAVAAAGSYELDLPIDNELFGVRSVGADGERSIAVDARPVVRRPPGLPPAK